MTKILFRVLIALCGLYVMYIVCTGGGLIRTCGYQYALIEDSDNLSVVIKGNIIPSWHYRWNGVISYHYSGPPYRIHLYSRVPSRLRLRDVRVETILVFDDQEMVLDRTTLPKEAVIQYTRKLRSSFPDTGKDSNGFDHFSVYIDSALDSSIENERVVRLEVRGMLRGEMDEVPFEARNQVRRWKHQAWGTGWNALKR